MTRSTIPLFLVVVLVISVSVTGYNYAVYAGGPRLDWDERYEDTPGAPECWVDGYDAGFSGKYDKDRADECKDIPGDQYNASWGHGCKKARYLPNECDHIKDNPDDMNHESLKDENRQDCYDDGYEDGRNNPFDHERNSGCDDYGRAYYEGFIDGCVSVEGNTGDVCESATDA
jgi:hypothetical protein